MHAHDNAAKEHRQAL